MSGDLSLFGDDGANTSAQPDHSEASIADWLVDSLRTALTARGLTTMAERQKAIEAVAERPVESLRSLTRAEAQRVLERLVDVPTTQMRTRSAWDERGEDTWIDRL